VASNLTVQLSSLITILDATVSPTQAIVTRSQNNPSYTATTVYYDPFFQAAAAGSAVTLAGATVYVLYVKNLNGTGGANIQVDATPAGGTTAILGTLVPGAVLLVFNTTTGTGYSAVTLTSSSGTSSCEVLTAY
jgi:hypothetical protein